MRAAPRSALLPTLALVTLLAACAERGPVAPGLDPTDAALAPAGGFRVVQLMTNGAGNGATANTLGDALAKVEAGGTIRVHRGTYDLPSALIDKPVTIEATGKDRPVLRLLPPDGRPESNIRVAGVATGTVTIRGLDIEAPAGAIVVDGPLGTLALEDIQIRMPIGGGGNGVLAREIGANGSIRMANSSITGGAVGFWLTAASTTPVNGRVEIVGSHISDTRDAGSILLGATTTLTANTLERCGQFFCLRVSRAAGNATLTGNTFRSTELPEGRGFSFAFNHNLVEIANGAQGVVRGNTFDGCGYGQCITFYNRASGEATGNRFVGYGAQKTRFAVVAADGSPGSIPEQGSSITVLDNEFVGVGATAADAESQGGYGFHLSAVLIEDGSTATVSRNRITNSRAAFVAQAQGRISGGSDNVVTGAAIGVQTIDFGQATLTRSDFQNVATSIHTAWQPTGAPVSDLRCNYWGGSAPTFFGPSSLAQTDPFSATPIAGRPEVSCG